jgi:hypothetical protein
MVLPVGCRRVNRGPGRFHQGFRLGFKADPLFETDFETVLETLLKPARRMVG